MIKVVNKPFQEIQKTKSHGCTDAEKAQFTLWTVHGLRFTNFGRVYRTNYRISALARSSTCKWYEDYKSSSGNSHRGGNGRPKHSDETNEVIRTLVYGSTEMSFKAAAT